MCVCSVGHATGRSETSRIVEKIKFVLLPQTTKRNFGVKEFQCVLLIDNRCCAMTQSQGLRPLRL
jgi:hypothetical protein